MLIRKGGISRNIEEKDLAQWKGKGYEVVEMAAESTDPVAPDGTEDTEGADNTAKKK